MSKINIFDMNNETATRKDYKEDCPYCCYCWKSKIGNNRKSDSPVLLSALSTAVIDYILTFLSLMSSSSKNTSVVSL